MADHTYQYTKNINYQKFLSWVACKASFSTDFVRLDYLGDDLDNNVHVIIDRELEQGEQDELAALVSAHNAATVIISNDVDPHEFEACAITLYKLNEWGATTPKIYLGDLTAYDSDNSSNCAAMYEYEAICQNDPTSAGTIYTDGETTDADPDYVGVCYSWNNQGTVTIYASREEGDPGSIGWIEIPRNQYVSIAGLGSGQLLRLKIVLTGGASLNWVSFCTDVSIVGTSSSSSSSA